MYSPFLFIWNVASHSMQSQRKQIISAGSASMDLRTAEEWAMQACARGGIIRAAWKLLGDIRMAHHVVDPCAETPPAFTGIRDSSAEKALAL